MTIAIPAKVGERAAEITAHYNLSSQDNIAAIVSALWILELGGGVKFLHDTAAGDAWLRDLHRRSAATIGTTRPDAQLRNDVLASEFEAYLAHQHPNHPEIDAVMQAGFGGLIALAITGADAHKAWNDHIQFLTGMQYFEPNIVGEGISGKVSYFLLQAPTGLSIADLPDQLSLWSNGYQDSINLLIHDSVIPLPGARLVHGAPGQMQHAPAQ